nr:activating molecule in BECN1-regulated autophagy protein 1-like [Lytechinus pictus]
MKRPKYLLRGVRDREIGIKRKPGSNDILRNYADFISAKYSSKIVPLMLQSNVRSTFLVSFSHDSALMASTHGNHHIYIWRVKTQQCIQTLVGHPRTPWTIMFHPSSKEILASGCLGGEVRVWDLQGSSEKWCSPNRTTITSLSFHPRDRLLAIATGNQIFLWDWNEPSPFTSVQTNSTFETVRLVKFDSLGHFLLTGIANLLPEQDASNSDENAQDSNQGSEESDPEPLEPDTYPAPSIPEPAIPPDILQGQQGESSMNRPMSPESMDTLEQAREYAASVTLNALRSRHQRGFVPGDPPNYPSSFAQPLGYLTRTSLPAHEASTSRERRLTSLMQEQRTRHSVESLSNLANFASNPPTNSLSQLSQNLTNEFALPRPAPVEADSTSPVNEQPQEIVIPSDDSDTPPVSMEESREAEPVMVEVEGENVQVAVVTDTRAGPSSIQPRAETAYVARIPSRRPRTQPNAESSGSHFPTALSHAMSVRGRSVARYQAQLSRRSLPGNLSAAGRRFGQGLSGELQSSSREEGEGSSLPEGSSRRRRAMPQLSRRSLQGQMNIAGRRYNPSVVGEQTLGRQGDDEGQSGEGMRRRRPSRFGFHRTALRRRVLHSHYSTSLFDNTQPPSPSVHYAINRAIANALAGRGQMAVANNISNRTHRLQWWDMSDYYLPDITDAQSNVIVAECKIHNDASVDISSDRRLAAFIPSHMGFPDHGVLAVCSLERHNLGEVLFTKSFGPNAITVSLSPSGNYILVGLAARRLQWQMFHGLMADVYQLQKPEAGEDSMTFVNRIIHPLDPQQRLVVSVNIARWIPRPGAGLVYGTNRGDLCFCTPKLDNEDEPVVSQGTSTSELCDTTANQLDMVERRRSYRELGMMAVRLSNSQTGSPSSEASRQASVSQSTQTGNSMVQNMSTQTDFGNEGHVAGRERIAERRSDVYEALRSGTFVEERAAGSSEGSGQDAVEEMQGPSGSHQRRVLQDDATGESDDSGESSSGVGGSERRESCDASTEVGNHGDQYMRGQDGGTENSRRTVSEECQAERHSASVSHQGSDTISRLASTNATCRQPSETNSTQLPSSINPEASIVSPLVVPTRRASTERDIPASSQSCRMLRLDSPESFEQPDSTSSGTGIRSSSMGRERSAFHVVGPGGDVSSSGLSSSSRSSTISYGHRSLSRPPIRFIESMSQEWDGSDPEEQRNMTGVSQSLNSRGRPIQSRRQHLSLDLPATHVVNSSTSDSLSPGELEEGSSTLSASPRSRSSHLLMEDQRSDDQVSSRSRPQANSDSLHVVMDSHMTVQASNLNTEPLNESLQEHEQYQELESDQNSFAGSGAFSDTEGQSRLATMEIDDGSNTAQDS